VIREHLPVLLVVVPLLGALIAPLLGGPRRAWTLAVAVTSSCLVGALLLLSRVLREGTVEYALGGWAAPEGITYRIDALNALFLVVVSAIAAVVTVPGWLTPPGGIGRHRLGFFYSVYLLCLTGLLGMAITGDAFNLYVLLEVSSLATYALVAMGRHRRARLAAFNYLILGSLGATFILLGIGYLYALTGTLDMMDMAQRLRDVPPNRALAAAFAFLVVGLFLKSALFPLHSWLLDAYTQAPASVAALLSGTATKVAHYTLIRFGYSILGAERFLDELPGRPLLLVLASLAILYGSWAAIRQVHAGRLLAYSSVAQGGYIVLGIALGTTAGLTAALVHVLGHAAAKGGLFLALGAVRNRAGHVDLPTLQGLGRRMPFTAAALGFGSAGLVGMPLTAGFVSKWLLVTACLEAGLWPLVLVIVAGALLAALYAWRLVAPLYVAEPTPDAPASEAPWPLVVPTWILIGANLAMGLFAALPVELARRAAEALP
jgi:multicomponent Na+:H+ antiporter subunit D